MTRLPVDGILIATEARPRVLNSTVPVGKRILTWPQIYDLPEHLVVIGSGVTGAELAQAYLGLGCQVTLLSSREQVLPGTDATWRPCSRTSSGGGGLHGMASVAAMQDRIAIARSLGDAVAGPGELEHLHRPRDRDRRHRPGRHRQGADRRAHGGPAADQEPAATMQNVKDGFVTLFARRGSDTIPGGVVAPRASELLFPIALAVSTRLNVDQFASTLTVYPSMWGAIAEAPGSCTRWPSSGRCGHSNRQT